MVKKPKFCILSAQRSGSTWLKSLLNSHPQITALDELFIDKSNAKGWEKEFFSPFYQYKKDKNRLRSLIVFEYLESLDDCNKKAFEIVGFKLMYNQIKKYPEIILKMFFDKYCIIHLVRKNHLDILISLTSANQYDMFHVKQDSSEVKTIALETSSLIKKLNYHKRRYQMFKTFLTLLPIKVIEVDYESLVNDKNKTLDTLTDFLQVNRVSIPLDSDHKKVNPGFYRDKISNYHQVLETLKHTEYASFIKE